MVSASKDLFWSRLIACPGRGVLWTLAAVTACCASSAAGQSGSPKPLIIPRNTAAFAGVPTETSVLATTTTPPKGYRYTGFNLMAPSEQWNFRTPMPTPRQESGVAQVGGKIYVIGGRLSPEAGTLSRVVEEYDPTTDTWSRKASMPQSLPSFSAGVLDGKIHVIGGHEREHPDSRDHLVFDPSTDAWDVRAPLISPRQNPGVAGTGGKLYVIGGRREIAGQPTLDMRTNYVYDPISDAWTTGSLMPTARMGLDLEVIDGKIYALGGSRHAVEVYDPATDAWSILAPMPDDPGSSMQYNGFAAVSDSKIFVFSRTDQVTVYDPAADRWSVASELSFFGKVAESDGTIFVFAPYRTAEFEPTSQTFYIHTNSR